MKCHNRNIVFYQDWCEIYLVELSNELIFTKTVCHDYCKLANFNKKLFLTLKTQTVSEDLMDEL